MAIPGIGLVLETTGSWSVAFGLAALHRAIAWQFAVDAVGWGQAVPAGGWWWGCSRPGSLPSSSQCCRTMLSPTAQLHHRQQPEIKLKTA